MKKGKLVRATAFFFAMMLVFTLLSRAADSSGVAVVTAEKPASRILSHTINVIGKVTQNQEMAVTTVADLRVSSIAVSEGSRVSKGDLLFELDEDYLDEQILYQEQELEKMELTIGDIESQQSVSSQQKANEQASASEQYALSVRSSDLSVSRVKEALQEAKDALAAYREESGTTTTTDSSVEAALEQAVEEKTEAYIDAQQELLSLQWKIEDAVSEALKAAQSSASLSGNSSVKTQSAGEEADIIMEETAAADAAEEAEEAEAKMIAAVVATSEDENASDAAATCAETVSAAAEAKEASVSSTAETTAEATAETTSETTEESAEIVEETETEAAASTEETPSAAGSASSDELIIESVQVYESETDSSGSSTSSGTLTQAELDEIEASVRSGYSSQLTAAQKAVEEALEEKEAAEAALEEYEAELLAASDDSASQAESELIAAVKSAQEAYEDAALAANESTVSAARAVASANIEDASDSSVRQQEITYEQMELTLKKLQALKEAGGKVYAAADGLITKINLTVGEKTSDGSAIMMADTSKGFRFTAELTKEEQQYIGAGDLVTLTGTSNKLENLAVDSVTADEEQEDVYNIVVQVPDDTFDLGAAVTLEFIKKSETYSVCVPLAALYLDENNQPYVMVMDEYETVMGSETRVRALSVVVLEKDSSYAALEEGALSIDQQVITGSDKSLSDGSRVRVE
ncbi:MAG: biotin/lipoyl-binding protein [Lachnospiraceae bacterium]|nr:biotin/lipoyl-binding protein [Lachnospiraceae bacterium]